VTSADFTKQLSLELIAKYGSIEAAAKSVAPQCTSDRLLADRPVAWRTVQRWISHAANDSNRTAGNRILDTGRIQKSIVGSYQVVTKDADGNATVHTLNKSSVTVAPAGDSSEFPVVQAASPTPIIYNQAPYVSRPISYAVVISDVQFGFLRDSDTGELEPIHDPIALAVAKQITADVRPESIYFVGDFCDLPMFSRWQQFPEYRGVLQPTIDGAYRELGEFIAAAGHNCTKRVLVGGNHDQRIEKLVLENNMDALGVRRACTSPAGWPVFSLGYLLRLDDLRIEFSGQYPGGAHYILDDLVITHAPPKKLEFAASVIHGHLHKLTTTTWAQHSSAGRQNYYMYDVGCLCQLGSTANKQRMMVTRVPSDRARTDWSQGLGVVEILGGKFPRHQVSLVKIDRGTAIYGGKTYGEGLQ
jgi:hypothetical protein